MIEHVEQATLRPGAFLRIDRDAQAEQHIADVAQARIGEQALDLRLAQRHQVADQHIERAKTHQQLAPRS
jgi:hypothetical protein